MNSLKSIDTLQFFQTVFRQFLGYLEQLFFRSPSDRFRLEITNMLIFFQRHFVLKCCVFQ